MLNRPNSMGPPWDCSSSLHMSTRRATLARTAACSAQILAPTSGSRASMFMGQWLRRAVKPLCISAQRLRARARSVTDAGQMPAWGKVSARYSAIANVSQMARSSCTSTGTVPVGVSGRSVRLNCESGAKLSKRTMTSSKAMPNWRIATQGRMDQDE